MCRSSGPWRASRELTGATPRSIDRSFALASDAGDPGMRTLLAEWLPRDEHPWERLELRGRQAAVKVVKGLVSRSSTLCTCSLGRLYRAPRLFPDVPALIPPEIQAEDQRAALTKRLDRRCCMLPRPRDLAVIEDSCCRKHRGREVVELHMSSVSETAPVCRSGCPRVGAADGSASRVGSFQFGCNSRRADRQLAWRGVGR